MRIFKFVRLKSLSQSDTKFSITLFTRKWVAPKGENQQSDLGNYRVKFKRHALKFFFITMTISTPHMYRYSYKMFLAPLWKEYDQWQFRDVSPKNLVMDPLIISYLIILYFHHSSAWYCTDILRKNSVLVTNRSLRVNGQLRKNVELTLLRQLLPFLEFYEDILPHHLSHTWSKKWMGNLLIRKTYSPS